MQLSVVISCHNEAAKIADCLTSVLPLEAEIIVMDHASDDETSVIAKKYTKHVFTSKNDPQAIDLQKNEGFAKAAGDWILSLDADERLTPEVISEIRAVLARPQDGIAGYYLPRKNIIFGKWIQHTGWYPDYQLRLFKRGKGKFTKQHVHEMLTIDGKTAQLSNPLIHYNFETISQFLYKHFVLYAPNEAEHLLSSGYTFSWTDAFAMPLNEFLSRYFARQGYLDGLHGLMLSIFMGFYHFVIFACIWEKKNFPEKDLTLTEVSTTLRKVGKDTEYWIKKEKTIGEKNPVLRKLKKHFS